MYIIDFIAAYCIEYVLSCKRIDTAKLRKVLLLGNIGLYTC